MTPAKSSAITAATGKDLQTLFGGAGDNPHGPCSFMSPRLLMGPRLLVALSPLVVLSLSITAAGIMMLPTATLVMDVRDTLRAIGTLQAVCEGGRYKRGYGCEYPDEHPEDQEDGGRAP
ncbi:hypothetical protein EDB19DRAFT_1908462 [Suillus lakei]|nr:hypothetical protein EDB19DRAFT_1908462 [Suillus lakei]